jgi:hypothetical protein
MTSYLLVISDREALGWVLTTGRMAFPNTRSSEVRSLKDGDELFIYTARSAFKNPTRDRGRIIGTARVSSEVAQLSNSVSFSDREYSVGCDLQIGPLAPFSSGVELAPLVRRLQAFKGAGSAWSFRLRRTLLRVTDPDAKLLHQVLDKVTGPDNTKADTVAAYSRWFLG